LLALTRAFRGSVTELRLSTEEFDCHPYLSLRLWERDQSGEWRPTRKGVSVRISECGRLAEVLAEVARQQSTPARPPAPAIGSEPGQTAETPPWADPPSPDGL
jgi:hypothetical protein